MEEDTKSAKPKSGLFERILIGIVAVLLLNLVLPRAKIKQSEECAQALEIARRVSEGSDIQLLETYIDDIYRSGVDNTNQQVSCVGEYQYMALEKLLLYQEALSRVVAECN